MITDYVKDDHAYLGCTVCGAETTILKWDMREGYPFPTINNEKSIEQCNAFRTKHALCKIPEQKELFKS